MLRILTGVLLLTLAGFVAYYQMRTEKPREARDVIAEQVANIAKQRDLSAEQRDLFTLQMAVLDYTSKNNRPPDSLTQLIPTYFDKIPINPKTGEVYKYRREGNRPLLGDLAESGATQMASAKKDTQASAAVEGVSIEDSDFINPNEMQAEDFVYDPTGKRDPFVPFDLIPKRDGEGLSPLEQFALGQLRLTAVLSVGEGIEPTGIVETAEGKGYTVKPGTKIGTNSGVVVSIEPDRLKILETTTKLTGEQEQKVQELILQVKTEEIKKPERKRR